MSRAGTGRENVSRGRFEKKMPIPTPTVRGGATCDCYSPGFREDTDRIRPVRLGPSRRFDFVHGYVDERPRIFLRDTKKKKRKKKAVSSGFNASDVFVFVSFIISTV